MKVLYLHQMFATREGSGGTRSYEFARYLLRQGHQVTMLAGRRQGGGTEQIKRATVDGIDLINLGGWYSPHLSMQRRVVSFLDFTQKAIRIDELPYRPDIVISTSTPLTIGVPGIVQARRWKVPHVFEVRDLWPQAPIELGVLKDPASKWVARKLERWIYRNSDHVIALSPGMADGVRSAGVPDERITMIPNASDTDLFSPEHRDRSLLEPYGLRDRFVVVHAGSMGRANGLMYLVDAARELQQMGRDDVHVLFAGDGGQRPELERRVRELALPNVTFAGRVQRSELGPLVSSCDVAVTSFANVPILATNSPNKLFDGLAAGIPNIVNSPGWTRDLVLDGDAGAFVDPTSPRALADEVIALKADGERWQRQARNARALALGKFERQLLAQRFERVLLEALGEPVAADGSDNATPAGSAMASAQ